MEKHSKNGIKFFGNFFTKFCKMENGQSYKLQVFVKFWNS